MQRVAQPLADRERRLRVRAAPRERRIGRLVGFGEDHVGAPDDVVRPRLPAVFGAAPPVIAGRLRHQRERAVGDAEPDSVPRREIGRLGAGAERIGRRMGLVCGRGQIETVRYWK